MNAIRFKWGVIKKRRVLLMANVLITLSLWILKKTAAYTYAWLYPEPEAPTRAEIQRLQRTLDELKTLEAKRIEKKQRGECTLEIEELSNSIIMQSCPDLLFDGR